jgi:hypothetical protein
MPTGAQLFPPPQPVFHRLTAARQFNKQNWYFAKNVGQHAGCCYWYKNKISSVAASLTMVEQCKLSIFYKLKSAHFSFYTLLNTFMPLTRWRLNKMLKTIYTTFDPGKIWRKTVRIFACCHSCCWCEVKLYTFLWRVLFAPSTPSVHIYYTQAREAY